MSIFPMLFFCVCLVTVNARHHFALDKHFVCKVKNTCFDCLKLPHCSWCEAENKCFSKNLSSSEFCPNTTVDHINYGFSLEENAQCACSGGLVELRCFPPGATERDGPECSGRGTCVCGQCACDPTPDPENPTKIILGEFCEFDNFSCDGPKCNEGPYSLSQPVVVDEDVDKGIPVNEVATR